MVTTWGTLDVHSQARVVVTFPPADGDPRRSALGKLVPASITLDGNRGEGVGRPQKSAPFDGRGTRAGPDSRGPRSRKEVVRPPAERRTTPRDWVRPPPALRRSHGAWAGGLDKGCIRFPESDKTNRCPCPGTRGSRRGRPPGSPGRPPESTSGGGGCLGPECGRESPGPWTIAAPRRRLRSKGDSPLALGDRAGSLPRRPCPEGGGGGGAACVVSATEKTPARVIDRRRRGLGAPLVQPTTLRRLRYGSKRPCLAP